jgi:hypothetical protein
MRFYSFSYANTQLIWSSVELIGRIPGMLLAVRLDVWNRFRRCTSLMCIRSECTFTHTYFCVSKLSKFGAYLYAVDDNTSCTQGLLWLPKSRSQKNRQALKICSAKVTNGLKILAESLIIRKIQYIVINYINLFNLLGWEHTLQIRNQLIKHNIAMILITQIVIPPFF